MRARHLHVALLLWALLTPLEDARRWAWTIIDAYPTATACEAARATRLDAAWTVCAEMGTSTQGLTRAKPLP